MSYLELAGIVTILTRILRRSEVSNIDIHNWRSHLSVGDVELLEEITTKLGNMSEQDKTLFYLKLGNAIIENIETGLNTKNTSSLIDLKVFLIKLFATLFSIITVIIVTSHLWMGKHFELSWFKNVWSIFTEMFLK